MKDVAVGVVAWALVLSGVYVALVYSSPDRCARCHRRIDDPETGRPVHGSTPAGTPDDPRVLCPECSPHTSTEVECA